MLEHTDSWYFESASSLTHKNARGLNQTLRFILQNLPHADVTKHFYELQNGSMEAFQGTKLIIVTVHPLTTL